MTDVIVGIIGVMLIVYLFIMVLRPERKWDRLSQKDSRAAAHWRYGSRHKTYAKAELSGSEGGKAKRPGRYKGPCERADASRSEAGPSTGDGPPQRDRFSAFSLGAVR